LIHVEEFKKAVGKFPTGVCVITTAIDGLLWGFTANSFVSVSLAPPLVSFCLNKEAGSFEAFIHSKYFLVNILANDQQKIAEHFAVYSPDKFVNINYHLAYESKTPFIDGAASFIECKEFKKIECGDHFIFVGEVVKINVDESKSPLLYFAKSYGEIK
jgi:flavin reductase (DIM6/NTAB) family NADH-FMN oxidoreductase RutF